MEVSVPRRKSQSISASSLWTARGGGLKASAPADPVGCVSPESSWLKPAPAALHDCDLSSAALSAASVLATAAATISSVDAVCCCEACISKVACTLSTLPRYLLYHESFSSPAVVDSETFSSTPRSALHRAATAPLDGCTQSKPTAPAFELSETSSR